MKGIEKMIQRMVKVDKFILMVMFILVNGKIIMLMVKEFIIIAMVANMKAKYFLY